MNISLLRQAVRSGDGVRRWHVAGYGNPATLIPRGVRCCVGTDGMFRFPRIDPQGHEMQFGVCLGRHRALARQEARRLCGRAGELTWKRLKPGCWHAYEAGHGLAATIVAQTERGGKRIYRYSHPKSQQWGIVRSIPRARKIVEKIHGRGAR